MNTSRRKCHFLLVSGLAALVAASAHADPGVYQHVLRSAVFIDNKHEESIGSGALVDLGNHLVVTNDHVVGRAKEVIVYFAANDSKGELITDPAFYRRNFTALRAEGIATVGTVIARWTEKDLAVVQLDQLPVGAQALSLAQASCPPGSSVHSVGNATDNGGLWVYTAGKVRNVYWKTINNGSRRSAYWLVTTSPTNPGDSGGPVVNDHGELVGIVSSGKGGKVEITPRGQVYVHQPQLIDYAVDIREVRSLLEHYPGLEESAPALAAAAHGR